MEYLIGHIEWIAKALTKALELAPSEIDIAIRIYVTSTPTTGSVDIASSSHTTTWKEDDSVHSSDETAIGRSRPSSLLNFSAVQVTQGRPDIPLLLREEVEANTGRMSVTGNVFAPY